MSEPKTQTKGEPEVKEVKVEAKYRVITVTTSGGSARIVIPRELYEVWGRPKYVIAYYEEGEDSPLTIVPARVMSGALKGSGR